MQIIIIIIQLVFLRRLKYHNHNQKREGVQSSFNERERERTCRGATKKKKNEKAKKN